VRREDTGTVRKQRRQLAGRLVLMAGEALRVPFAEQVGPPGRPIQQRAAREHRSALGKSGLNRCVAEHVGEVRERVARCGQGGDQHAGANLDGVPVADGGPCEAHLVEGVHVVGRAGAPSERETAGDVVVVDMGLEDIGQPDVVLLQDRQDPVDVSLQVDDQGDIAVMDDVAAVAESGGLHYENREILCGHAPPYVTRPSMSRRTVVRRYR
jgi:hypothetical protein